MDVHISKFLLKFKSVGLDQLFLKDETIRIVKKITGAIIMPKDVSLKNNELLLSVSPILRSELMLKKKIFETELSHVIEKNNIKKIR